MFRLLYSDNKTEKDNMFSKLRQRNFYNRLSKCISYVNAPACEQCDGSRTLDAPQVKHKTQFQSDKFRTYAILLGIAGGAYIWRKKSGPLGFIQEVECATIRQPPKLREQFNFIAEVVENVVDAVVYIEAMGSPPGRRSSERVPVSNGSGFIIQEDGLILTNAHVVMQHGTEGVRVRLSDGTTYPAHIESVDMKSDLATIRIQAKNLPVLKMGSSSDLRVGEWVVAIGSPLTLSNTVTAGVVSASERPAKQLGIAHNHLNYIQTDASITVGNSGGPLVNLDGEAIGINSIKVSPGISFAIPIDYAKEFIENAKNNNTVARPSEHFIGITMVTLKPGMVMQLQALGVLPPDVTWGVLVWKIHKNGPAYRVGLKAGDVITQVNDKAASSVQDMYDALKTGKPITLRFYTAKNGHPVQVIVEPEIRNLS